ncbi:hypothetical protein D3C77_614350 [compost metagenome]
MERWLLLRQIEIQFGSRGDDLALRLLRRHHLVQGATLLQQDEATRPQQEQQQATATQSPGQPDRAFPFLKLGLGRYRRRGGRRR